MRISCFNITAIFDFDFLSASTTIEGVQLSWAFCASCLSVRVFQRG